MLGLSAAPGTARAAEPDAVELTTACEGTTSAGFTDTEGTTFEFEIDCFAHRGFTKGTANGSTYEPFASNTRWQMATFIHRVLVAFAEDNEEFEVPEPSDQGYEDIDSLDQEFRDAINVLAELGVVEGRTSTRFEPYATVRRDQRRPSSTVPPVRSPRRSAGTPTATRPMRSSSRTSTATSTRPTSTGTCSASERGSPSRAAMTR